MRALCIPLLLVSSVAAAQEGDLATTFGQIGKGLESINQSLSGNSIAAMKGSGFPTPSGESLLEYWTVSSSAPAEVWTDAKGDTKAGFQLNPNTPVKVLDTTGNLWTIKPQTPGLPADRVYYVDKSSLAGSMMASFAGDRISDALDEVKKLAILMQTNKYIRLEGFSVSVSTSPSIDIDFKMLPVAPAEGTAASPP
jgi:hypothetical protein